MNKKLNEAYNNLSEKEQKSYNLIMAKIAKVMNQITNKTQREGVMKKFKDSLEKNNSVSNKVKKLTALTMSVLILASPVTLLTGCDKDGNIATPGSNITIETNKDGEVVNSVSDQLANSVYKENDKKAIDTNYLSCIDVPFKYFDIQKVVDGSYANNIYSQINFWLEDYKACQIIDNHDVDAELSAYRKCVIDGCEDPVILWDAGATECVLNAQITDFLLNKNSSYAFNVYVHSDLSSNDNSYQLVKDKDQTFCIIETKSDGTKLYNGYVNNIAFTDSLDDLNGYYPSLTSEYEALIQQAGGDNALLWGQGVIGCMLSGGGLELEDNRSIPMNAAGYNIESSDYSESVGGSYISATYQSLSAGIRNDSYFTIKQRTIGILSKEKGVFTEEAITGPIYTYIKYQYDVVNPKDPEHVYRELAEHINNGGLEFSKISGIDFVLNYKRIINPNNYAEKLDPIEDGYEDNVVLVGMVPTELENVQLPTTEAEAEK